MHKNIVRLLERYLPGVRDQCFSNVTNPHVRDTINEVSSIVAYVMDNAKYADLGHIAVSGNIGSIVIHL
jgi:hypothetical protein